MPVQTACPPAQEFEVLLTDRASSPDNRRLFEHLESCPTCWKRIAPLLDRDTLLSGVAVSQPRVPSELLDRLMALRSTESTGEFGVMSVTPLDFDAAKSPDQSPPPRTIGHYEIGELLGRGGMGAVYLATDTRLNRPVALKLMLPRFAAIPSAKERFLREARAAAQIANDNVVTIYEADERDGNPYIAMQYLQGATLEQHLKARKSFTVPQILSIAEQTANGLAAAHAIGLVHRDIKPGNLWLESPNDRAKVLDFGLAKPLESDVELTGSGTMVGTPTFMSPEQARGKNLDGRTDLFSLGVVLYRLCTGRLPFEGPNAMAILMALGTEEPKSIRDVNPAIPSSLSQLIADLLAKNPDNRPQSAAEVAQRLRAIASGQTQPLKQKPQRPTIAVAVGLAALFAAVALGIIIIIKNKDGSETKIDVPDGASVTVKDSSGKTHATVDLSNFETWRKAVSTMPSTEQTEAVTARLKQLNPKFDERGTQYKTENGVVVGVYLETAEVTDLSPLRALPGLVDIYLSGKFRNPRDISPLRGMKLTRFQTNGCPLNDLSPLAGMPLTTANFWGNATADLSPLKGMKLKFANVGHGPARDISVFKGMPLEDLCLNLSQVDDLRPLIGAPLRRLEIENTKVTDLSPLANMPIESLALVGSPIKDYSPLRTMTLTWLKIDDPKRHIEVLRSIPTLKTLNMKPVAEVLGDD